MARSTLRRRLRAVGKPVVPMVSAALLVGIAVAGCTPAARVSDHADWLKEATRVWPGETRARVISAAEAVVKHADPRDTTIEYNRHGFAARRKFFIYALIATASGTENWTFSSAENVHGASATVRIVQRGTAQAGSHSERFRENQVYLGSLRLFYARIDYLLGRRPDWITCSQAQAKLALPVANPGLQSLCSLTHQGKDTPPPPKVAARAGVPKSVDTAPPAPPDLPPDDPGT
jgi:hypothetical protein